MAATDEEKGPGTKREEEKKTSVELPSCSATDIKAEDTSEGAKGEKEDDSGVTMVEVLQDEEELEEDAKAVLGAADDKNCSYTSGYMVRQALYACISCCPPAAPDFNPAGVCLACSYHCHEGCDIVELYTKRNFKCDCGNSKFKKKCKLWEDKEKLNSGNQYNQNFSGLYCTCHRPYPDPEDPVPDSMIQCIMCEDWFHGRHLAKPPGSGLPSDDSYSEMICQLCHQKYRRSFLHAYAGHSVTKISATGVVAGTVNVEDVKEANREVSITPATPTTETKIEAGAGNSNDEKCLLEKCPPPPEDDGGGGGQEVYALFMVSEWRKQLCQCSKCAKMYAEIKVAYLNSEEDTVHHYEEKAKGESGSQYEEGMKALSEMDRVKQVEAIQGYNSMKSNLMDYLRSFAEEGKVVKKEDITAFFEQMSESAAKRRRVEIPKFCN